MYKYSRRLLWESPSNSLTRLLQAKRSAGVPLLDLTVSNPTEALSEYPHSLIRDTFAQLSDFTYRPDPFGQERTRSAISHLYRCRGISVSVNRIVLTASTSETYALLFKMFCDAGTEILVPVPSYPLFEYLAALESLRVISYRLLYDGAWFIDWPDLLDKISSETRAIVLVNPNNPTGSFLKKQEAEELFRICRKYELPIISDEVFFDYSFGQVGDRITTLTGSQSILSFSLNGLSKSAAMPQMKLGWMVINGPDDQVEIARSRLELLLDTYLSVSTPVQQAAPKLLKIGMDLQRQLMARTKRNLHSLRERLEESPAHVLNVEGGWSAIVQLPRTISEEAWVIRLLEEQGVIVQPGYFFDMASEAYVVVSLITPPDEFDEGILRLRKIAAVC